MTSYARDPLYRRHRFPAQVIAHAVWLYFRFPLSLRMVEDMLAARGIIVSHQTVRLWAEKFGRHFANDIRKRSAGKLGDKWHLDETVITIRGKKHWLWRAVDQDGFVLDVLVQSRHNAKAAKRLLDTQEVVLRAAKFHNVHYATNVCSRGGRLDVRWKRHSLALQGVLLFAPTPCRGAHYFAKSRHFGYRCLGGSEGSIFSGGRTH